MRKLPTQFPKYLWSWKVPTIGSRILSNNHYFIQKNVHKTLDSIWYLVRYDPRLPGDSGKVSNSEWSGWRFDSCCETVSLPDG